MEGVLMWHWLKILAAYQSVKSSWDGFVSVFFQWISWHLTALKLKCVKLFWIWLNEILVAAYKKFSRMILEKVYARNVVKMYTVHLQSLIKIQFINNRALNTPLIGWNWIISPIAQPWQLKVLSLILIEAILWMKKSERNTNNVILNYCCFYGMSENLAHQ